MNKPVYVSLSGPAFSYILLENSKSRYKQEGFLLGEVIHRESRTITDNDQEQINISKIIKITSVIPCPHTNYFYNGYGRVDAAKVKDFLGDQFTSVVAWYKYNRVSISNFKLTLRDRLVHRQLQAVFEAAPPDLFAFCMLIAEASDNRATHTYSQLVMRYNSATSGWDKLPVHVPNLSDANAAYQSAERASDTFRRIVQSIDIDTKAAQGAIVAGKIQMALQAHTESLLGEVVAAEQRLHQLEQEVGQLRRKRAVGVANRHAPANQSARNCTKMEVVTDLDDVDEDDNTDSVSVGGVEGAGDGSYVTGEGAVQKRGRGRAKKYSDCTNVNISTRKRKS